MAASRRGTWSDGLDDAKLGLGVETREGGSGSKRDLGGLSGWAPELADALVALSSDIALVIGAGGVIEKVVQSGQHPVAQSFTDWVGRRWADTVTADTRAKIERLLEEVASTGLGRRREVNHPAGLGDAVPVAYTAIRLGVGGPLLAVGRDLRAVGAIQQRFLDTQREMEQFYWRARQADSRSELLFQVATDAMLLLDGQTRGIVEANEAAASLFDLPIDQLIGQPATSLFDKHSRAAVGELLASTCTAGKQGEVHARLEGKVIFASVAATPFRIEESVRLLLRVRTALRTAPAQPNTTLLPRSADDAADAVAVTDSAGRILAANPAFLALASATAEEQVRGRSLHGWFGDGRELEEIIGQVRRQGLVRRGQSSLRFPRTGNGGVELSATLLSDGDQEQIGFRLHRLLLAASPVGQGLGAKLTELLGSSEALPDLMRKASALVERHFVVEALERSAGDAAAAARLLGIGLDELESRLGAPEAAQDSGI